MRNWLKSLPLDEDRKRIGEDIKTVEFGWPIGMPVCRSLGDGVYEVRTSLAQNRIARILFYIDKKGRMVLLHGFIKKTPKTPNEDLELARTKYEPASKRIDMKTKKVRRVKDRTGSTFDSFLEDEGIREEVEAVAIKRVLAWQLKTAMKEQRKTKQLMAKQLRTSRSQLDRLLDPQNVSVTIATITRAARALGMRVILHVTDMKAKRA